MKYTASAFSPFFSMFDLKCSHVCSCIHMKHALFVSELGAFARVQEHSLWSKTASLRHGLHRSAIGDQGHEESEEESEHDEDMHGQEMVSLRPSCPCSRPCNGFVSMPLLAACL